MHIEPKKVKLIKFLQNQIEKDNALLAEYLESPYMGNNTNLAANLAKRIQLNADTMQHQFFGNKFSKITNVTGEKENEGSFRSLGVLQIGE